jgi:predicted metal-dependent enzyme (double-stranded beta helix superfamily)
MKNRDFLVTRDGHYQVCQPAREWDLLRTPYYFHRFLTEVEDAVDRAADESDCLPALRLIVRRLITNSYWIHTQQPEPDPKTRSSARLLYDEIGFPLTVQVVTDLPEVKSSIHNHGNWGIVAILKGEEKNTLWQRVADPKQPNRIEPVSEITLLPGDIISFTPDAIHNAEALGDEPTVTFSIYGETHHSRRFEFDPISHTTKNF